MSSLADKLQIRQGQALAVQNAPAGSLERLALELAGISVTAEPAAPPDGVLLFVTSLDEAERLAPGAMRAARPDGLVWIAYPKGSSGVKTDVNRDRLWEALQPTGWRPVRQVALDDVWSAMRFRPADQVGRK
jgi:hypothetical protein